MSGLPGSTPEPYVLRKAGPGQILPVVVLAAWIALIELTGLDFPLFVIVAAAAFALVRLVLDTERLRVGASARRVSASARRRASRGSRSMPSAIRVPRPSACA